MERAAGDIFVISDLHIGDAGARDNFEAGDKTRQLRAFLDHVGSEGGQLFVLGDLFELWQINLSVMFVKRRELLDQFASLDLVFVPGNHDIDLAHFVGTDFLMHPFFAHMRAPFVRQLGGKSFRFFHGHETDPFNSGDDPGFGRMLAIFAGIFEDETGSPLLQTGESVEGVLEQFGDSMLTIWAASMAALRGHVDKRPVPPKSALTPAQNPDRLGEHLRGVRADMEAQRYDVAVLGHTHKPGRLGDWYFNSGSWTGPHNPFLRISSEGHVRYFEWKDRHAIEHEVPEIVHVVGPREAAAAAHNPFQAAVAAVRTFFPKPTMPARPRWILMLQGVLAIALGIATLKISIGQGSTAGWRILVTAFGVYCIVDGILSLVGGSSAQPIKRLLARIRGAASLLIGVVVLRRGYTVDTFVLLVGFLAFFSGGLRVAASLVFKTMVDARWLLLAGIGSMLAGLVLILVPTSAPLLKYALAAYLCYYGLGELMAGIFGQRLPRPAVSFARAFAAPPRARSASEPTR